MRHSVLSFRTGAGKLLVLLFLLSLSLILSGPAQAQSQSVIRDEEIERTLKGWIKPVIEADGLDPQSVHIILVQSPEINAFVAGGQNIFLYTGLLSKTENAGEIVAVLAHELGHIEGGHLIRGSEQMKNASFEALLGSVIGIGAAILAGDSSAGVGVGSAASSLAIRNYLSFSRVQESSADQAGLRGMRESHINPTGMLTFLQKLQGEELLPDSQQDPYVRTHPLTRERIDVVRNGVEKSPYKDVAPPAAWAEQHARLKAKLAGFINPQQVAWNYPDRDDSIAARYARTIAAYRDNRLADATRGIDRLIADETGNPYFQELKGQILVDFGRVGEALPYYRKAVGILPDAGLIRIAYGSALLESAKDQAQIAQAAQKLERSVHDEPRSILAQRLLATAYGRMGQEPKAKLHLAVEGLLKGDKGFAQQQANEALQGLKPGSSDWLRARDVMDAADQMPDRAKRRRVP